MRCDQYVGLNEWARNTVSATHVVREVGHRILPSGKSKPFDRTVAVPLARTKQIGKIAGAWTDVVAPLLKYTMPSGEVYEEFVQATPWSSGPCYFIALKDGKGQEVPESLWTEEELNNA